MRVWLQQARLRPMRSDMSLDQAEGLRRLLVRGNTRVITLVAGKSGVGRTSIAINLAAAMVHFGKEVLVLDENHAPNNLLGNLGLHADYDFLDIVQSKCKPGEALLSTKGFAVLSTARAVQSLGQLQREERQHLENTLARMSSGVDVLLVDAGMPVLSQDEVRVNQMDVPSGLVRGASLLVVVDATASGITDSYALIKRLVIENASLQFEIVVNKVANEKMAMTVFNNMAKVAWGNLATRLDYFGFILFDHKIKRATQLGRSVVEAFPAAVSAKSYLALSQKLLRLSVRQAEVESGALTIMKNLMKHVSKPTPKHSTTAVHTS